MKGRAMLLPAVRRRLSRVLRQIAHSELVLIETGQNWRAGRPSHVWQRTGVSLHDATDFGDSVSTT
jgi:hypothetical protein